VSMAEAHRESGPGEHHRRVVLLAESAGLAAVLGHLLGPADRLSRLDSLRELPDGRLLEDADLVVLDLPDEDRATAVAQVRRRYRGPLVILAGEEEEPGGSDLDGDCTLLARPFSVEQLSAALAGQDAPPPRPAAAAPVPPPRTANAAPTPPQAAGTPPRAAAPPAPAATPSPAPVVAAAPARRDPLERDRGMLGDSLDRVRGLLLSLGDRGQRLLIELVEGWRTRRQVRVAGFGVLALLGFTVAFALAAQGRCGSGCDQLGTGLSPARPITSVESHAAASATSPKHPTSTTTIRVGPSGTGAFLGTPSPRRTTATSGWSPATTTTRAPATTRRPVTTRPATTRPGTTQSTAPTTAPTTTVAPPTTEPTPGLEAPTTATATG
jgi:hypothetical protein